MKKLYLSFLFLICIQFLFSQVHTGTNAEKLIEGATIIKFKDSSKTPSYIKFKDELELSVENAIMLSKKITKVSNTDFRLTNKQNVSNDKYIYRYTQTINGYPIEFTAWNIHTENNRVHSINGNIFEIPIVSTIFTISEQEALQKALAYYNAYVYMWEDIGEENLLKTFKKDNIATYYPNTQKVIVPNNFNFLKAELKSAYKFDIFSKKPYDRKMIYVDAQTGEIILDLPLINASNAVGTAHTQYYGTRTISTEYTAGSYILKDNTRGNGIHTLNCNNRTEYYSATEFTDNDNIWNNVNVYLDEYATDAHFATISTYDYFFNIHNRNSIDNNGHELLSYVHFNLIEYGYGSNVNAFWNGQWMTYGDGDLPNGITPLTTLDICAHEITHGLTSNTAQLIYSHESGALNEAFSDIFGTAVEFYANPENANWLVGSEVGKIMRSMENPKLLQSPDTYKGEYWVYDNSDRGGVHTNSGPMNYWFYLACVGGSGINDLGNTYSVTGIGIEKVEKIAYKLLTEYLTYNSDYSDACFYGMLAAADLYGECSSELEAISNAFYAIGIKEEPYSYETIAQFYTTVNENCRAPFEVKFKNQSSNSSDFIWDFGDGNIINSNESYVYHIYENTGIYNVKLVANSPCGTSTEIKNNYIKIDENLPCFTEMNYYDEAFIESCNGLIYGPGGESGSNYYQEVNSSIVIHAPNASQIILEIIDFSIESLENECSENYIAFYDGSSTNANLINNTLYCNQIEIPNIISSSGEYITIKCQNFLYYNPSAINRLKIRYNCIGDNQRPATFFSVDNSSTCNGIINFIDNSINAPTNWEWDFGDGATSNFQNPTHQYSESGTYSVKLTTSNNFGTNYLLKENYITVRIPSTPEINNIESCNNSEFDISLNLIGEAYWYNNIYETTPFYIGNNWTHAPVEQNKTYYIKEVFNNTILNLGPTNNQTNGNNYSTSGVNHYLNFDAYIPFKLKSVSVNAYGSGYHTIALKTNTNNIIFQEDIYIPDGVSRVNLNIDIPAHNGLKLICMGTPDLFRSDLTAGIEFPYYIENIIKIKGTSSSYDYYYFFYDWQIEIESCKSDFAEIELLPVECLNTDNTKIFDNTSIAPNPGNGIYTIYGLNNFSYYYDIIDIYGKKIISNQQINNQTIDIRHLPAGVYFFKISTNDEYKIIKLINKK